MKKAKKYIAPQMKRYGNVRDLTNVPTECKQPGPGDGLTLCNIGGIQNAGPSYCA